MTTTQIVVLIVVVVTVLALVALALLARKRQGLQHRFGPEYDHTVEATGGRRAAEKELQAREQRRDELDIQPLDPQVRQDYAERWRQAQESFVDQPGVAVHEADVLVTRVMSDRGYPVDSFDQQVRDVSVDHAGVVEHYRAAHDIAERENQRQATTEELRTAMVHYRSLFSALLDDSPTSPDRSGR